MAAGISAITALASKIYEMEAQARGMIDAKTAAAVATLTASRGMQSPPQNLNWNPRSILESKAVQDIDRVVDAQVYRQWNRKVKIAVEHTRTKARPALEMPEKLTEETIQEMQ